MSDIFLLCSTVRRRFIHTGIVVGVQDEERVQLREIYSCVTVEGNTINDGSSSGHTTLHKVRTFREADGHKFIRWAELSRQATARAHTVHEDHRTNACRAREAHRTEAVEPARGSRGARHGARGTAHEGVEDTAVPPLAEPLPMTVAPRADVCAAAWIL